MADKYIRLKVIQGSTHTAVFDDDISINTPILNVKNLIQKETSIPVGTTEHLISFQSILH